jgi:hypothetical protein
MKDTMVAGSGTSEPQRGEAMYRFERKLTVKNVADMPAAMQFASDVTTYLNKRYDLHMRFGAEGFDKSRVHWFYDFENADKSAALGQSLLQDAEYNALLNKAKGLWLDGSLEDTFVNLVN